MWTNHAFERRREKTERKKKYRKRNKMDYSKLIKSLLESNELNSILDELQLDRDSLLTQVVRNICCSNNSYVFIYLEQSACFLALSLDRMCKSEDKSYSKSFQVSLVLNICIFCSIIFIFQLLLFFYYYKIAFKHKCSADRSV